MNIILLREQYWFHDGVVRAFHLDLQQSHAEIELFVRRIRKQNPSGPLKEEDLDPCTLQLVFDDLIEVSLFDKFPTQGNYLNFSTFDNGGSEFGVSLTVHDSSSHIEKDNWVIKSRRIEWKEV
jgi:hypothetical protein